MQQLVGHPVETEAHAVALTGAAAPLDGHLQLVERVYTVM